MSPVPALVARASVHARRTSRRAASARAPASATDSRRAPPTRWQRARTAAARREPSVFVLGLDRVLLGDLGGERGDFLRLGARDEDLAHRRALLGALGREQAGRLVDLRLDDARWPRERLRRLVHRL